MRVLENPLPWLFGPTAGLYLLLGASEFSFLDYAYDWPLLLIILGCLVSYRLYIFHQVVCGLGVWLRWFLFALLCGVHSWGILAGQGA